MTDAGCLIGELGRGNYNLRLHVLEDGSLAVHNIENTWTGRSKTYAGLIQVIREMNRKQDNRCPTCNQEVPHE